MNAICNLRITMCHFEIQYCTKHTLITFSPTRPVVLALAYVAFTVINNTDNQLVSRIVAYPMFTGLLSDFHCLLQQRWNCSARFALLCIHH